MDDFMNSSSSNKVNSGGRALACFVVLWQALIAHASPPEDAVVDIYCVTGNGGSSQGTGFVIAPSGLVVTAYHVIQGARSIQILRPGVPGPSDVAVEYLDPDHDVAALSGNFANKPEGLQLGTDPPPALATVQVLGSPRGSAGQVLTGRLTFAHSGGLESSLRFPTGATIFAHDIDVYPIDVTNYNGMSGAPVTVGPNDSVIGLFAGSLNEGGGLGWAIPAKYVAQLLNGAAIDKMANQLVTWPALRLMSSAGWTKLLRSYGKVYSAEHLATLQLLDKISVTLKGTWHSSLPPQHRSQLLLSTSTPELVGTSCTSTWTPSYLLVIGNVDPEKALISAHFSVHSDSSVSPAIADCNSLVYDDPQTSHRSTTLEIDSTITIPDISEYSDDNDALDLHNKPVDCEGSCGAEIYDRGDGTLEPISATKFRVGPLIFNKQ